MSTPTRPFGKKQAPAPLPDAKSCYKPFLKRELARRLTLICVIFFCFTFLALLLSTLDFQRGPPLGVLGHLVATILMTFFTLAVGALPPLILRGRAVSASGTPPPTRAALFITFTSSCGTWRTLACFAASGFGLTLLHVVFINLTEWEDSRLTVLAPTRRNAFRLNERFFYLAFFNATLGLVFATRNLLKHRWIINWSPMSYDRDAAIINTPLYSAIETLVAALNHKALLSTSLITIIHVLSFPLSYHVSRMCALPLLRNLPAFSWFMRPLLHGFGRTWLVDVTWSRMLALGFKTSLGWELVESSFDYWSVKPIATSPKAQDPNQALISGLHSQDRYFKHHAYLELSALATSSSAVSAARRTALFTDTKTTPTLWSALSRELLMTLGRDYQHLRRRGKPAPPVPVSTSRSVPRSPSSKTPSTPLLRQAILKPSPRTLFDRLASNDADMQSPAPAKSRTDPVDVPSVFLPSTPSTPSAEKKTVVKAVDSKLSPISQIIQRLKARRNAAVMSVLRWAERQLSPEWQIREWWMDIQLENVARACLLERELDVAGIDALSHLVAASLTEDTLGTVQRDIPRVLEALLSFLGEAELYQAELESKLPSLANVSHGSGDMHVMKATGDVERAVAVVQPVIIALRTGIGLIAKTFGDRLGVYRFPPPTAKRLQNFMDYI